MDLLREAALLVSFTDWQDKVSLADFRNMKRLALAEMWGRPDVDLATALKLTSEQMLSYPKLPEFAQIKEALLAAFQSLRDPKTLKEHIEDKRNQDLFFREMRLGVKNRSDAKAAGRMLETFADRAMPVMSQKAERQVIMIRESTINRLGEVEREMEALGVSFAREEEGSIVNADPTLHRGLPPAREEEGT